MNHSRDDDLPTELAHNFTARLLGSPRTYPNLLTLRCCRRCGAAYRLCLFGCSLPGDRFCLDIVSWEARDQHLFTET